jgi:Domain of unknown function (DUF4381)
VALLYFCLATQAAAQSNPAAQSDATPQPDPLAALVDIPLPPSVSLWPQTWTSRITIVVLAVSLIAALWWFVRWRYANRYRRAALAELDNIERASAQARPNGTVSALAVLVRRTALAAFPREEVAALGGPAWLAFLDRHAVGHDFAQGPGRVLGSGPYQPSALGDDQTRALIGVVRRWIRTHHA